MNWHLASSKGLTAVVFGLVVLAGLTACHDRAPLGPEPGLPSSLAFSVSGPAYVRVLVISVTGPGIDSTLVFNIPVSGGTASGTISVPSGSQRHLVAQAYDSLGVNTHRADTTLTLQPGPGTQVSLVLLPLLGDLPVVLAFGSLSFAIAPNDTAISLGDSTLFTATITDRAGRTLVGVRPRWATANPAVATVDSLTGMVRGRRAGTTVIVAVYGGASASRSLQVIAGPVAAIAANYMKTCALNTGGHIYCWGASFYSPLTPSTYASATPVLFDGSRVYRSLSVGEYHSCALATDGTAYCWGRNDYGQLGDGTTASPKTTPVAVAGGLSFVSIGAGRYHSCGLATTGVVYCWGDNSIGQMGNAPASGSTTPVAVSGGLHFLSITVGWNHQCGFAPGGIAYCWGNNGNGRLGDGTTTNRATPTAVSGGLVFLSLVANTNVTCGIKSDGAAYCWGRNFNGRLGDGTTTDRTTPTAVSGGLAFQSLSIGYAFACGLTLDGAAYCWGANGYGQLGDGTRTTHTTPLPVSGGQSFQALSAGYYHACGVSVYGRTLCWGMDTYGQVGTGAANAIVAPAPVTGDIAFASLTADGSHVCGLTSGGVAYCWGSGGSGELGNGSTDNTATPTAVSGGYTWLALHAGPNATCGLAASGGTVYCWGANFYGELGDSTLTGHSTPAAVTGGPFASLATGDGSWHECALTSAGAAYCWGQNTYGELGDGTTTDRAVPTAVQQGSLTFVSISTGGYSTCALTATGAAYCWGDNTYGALGEGTTTNRLTPTAVLGGLTFTALTLGNDHGCGLTTAGAAYCWGGGYYFGFLDSQPVLVAGSHTFLSIAAGDVHTCGIATDGVTYCWGSNEQGQLGIGSWTIDRSTTPLAVTGSQMLTTIAGGSWFACGATASGAAYCWGWNAFGELGRGTFAVATTPTAVAVPSTVSAALPAGYVPDLRPSVGPRSQPCRSQGDPRLTRVGGRDASCGAGH